jgi:hypothetical protein
MTHNKQSIAHTVLDMSYDSDEPLSYVTPIVQPVTHANNSNKKRKRPVNAPIRELASAELIRTDSQTNFLSKLEEGSSDDDHYGSISPVNLQWNDFKEEIRITSQEDEVFNDETDEYSYLANQQELFDRWDYDRRCLEENEHWEEQQLALEQEEIAMKREEEERMVEEPRVHCQCPLRGKVGAANCLALLRESFTKKNPNRMYWACRKRSMDSAHKCGCTFFAWCDEFVNEE